MRDHVRATPRRSSSSGAKDDAYPFAPIGENADLPTMFPIRNFFCPVPVRMVACFVLLGVRGGFNARDECTMNGERNCDHNRNDVLKKLFSL
jgi:hypothetical protein